MITTGTGLDEVVMMEAPDVADVDSDQNTTELKRFYYHTQLIGSVTHVTDPDEVVVESYDYGPYGEIEIFDQSTSTVSASQIGNPFTYTGRRLDEESGLFYYRARHYSSELKRFIQRDPLGYVEGPNPYAYSLALPTIRTDARGTYSWAEFKDDVGALAEEVKGAIVASAKAVTGVAQTTVESLIPAPAAKRGVGARTSHGLRAPLGKPPLTRRPPMPSQRSRVHPTYKTRYRVTNWREYDRGLVDRGDLTLWISQAAIDAWHPQPSGARGGQRRYSDTAIQTALTLRLLFRLPLRQTEGFLRSLLRLLGLELDAPDHTTLSRRARDLALPTTRQAAAGPVHLVLDSTGLSVVGEGEWAAARFGARGVRGWRKLHLGVDGDGGIVAHVLTDSCVDDACAGVAIIEHVPGELARVTADAGYDTHEVYDAATARGAEVVIPPISSAKADQRLWPRSPARDATVRRIQAVGRRAWKRESGYHRQGTVENAFFRWKTLIGPALRSRDERSREVEAALGCDILNRMLEIARPRSVAVVA